VVVRFARVFGSKFIILGSVYSIPAFPAPFDIQP
jgi:hypothetical protein